MMPSFWAWSISASMPMLSSTLTAGTLYELARAVRRNRVLRALPIILLTGINAEYPLELSAGDIDPEWIPVQKFLEKPVDVARLLRPVAMSLPLDTRVAELLRLAEQAEALSK